MLNSLLIDFIGADKIMLTIPRKKGESVVIGDSIIVTVVEIRGDEVQLSIEHPPEASSHRRESYDAIRREVVFVQQSG